MSKKAVKIKSKKLHVEIAPVNWLNIKKQLEEVNQDPNRVTLEVKADHIINQALAKYLSNIQASA